MYGVLFIFLNSNLNWDSFSPDTEDVLGEQIEINLEDILAEATPPLGTVEKSASKESFKGNKQHKLAVEASSKEIVSENSQETAEEIPVKKDTVMLNQLKKIEEALQNQTPKDTLAEVNTVAENLQRDFERKFNTYEEELKFRRENYRAIYNFKKIYPYVIKTKKLVADLNAQLATVKDKQERKTLIKNTEKKLFEEYESAIRNMSRSQGNLLLKLIARETSQTGYGLVKEYKGSITASFWYGVGLMFRQNLKTEYDSLKTDTLIEKIIVKYNKGKL